jgi:hypothetical protein
MLTTEALVRSSTSNLPQKLGTQELQEMFYFCPKITLSKDFAEGLMSADSV